MEVAPQRPYAVKISDQFVADMSAIAFSVRDQRSRIEPLTLLDGVEWPTASVILRLFHPDPYPILDFRALWSAGSEPPSQYCSLSGGTTSGFAGSSTARGATSARSTGRSGSTPRKISRRRPRFIRASAHERVHLRTSAACSSFTTSPGPFGATIVQHVPSSPVKTSGRAIRPAIHSCIRP
jgi:hypothetical protein